MNRRNRTLVVVGLAVVLASIASWGVYRAIQQIPVREVTIVERQMVVAAGFVPVGVLLTDKHMKLIPWPANAPVPGGFEKVEDAVGRGVTSQLVENEPVTESKLAPKDSGGGLPPNIPSGMRAMSVRVNDVIGVSGFALQGTHVDVIVTVRTANNDTVSRLAVNNLLVLASGPAYDPAAARSGEAKPTNVVTLAVTPEDAEKLALATSQGSIVLVLRNPLDTVPVETKGVRMNALLAEPAPPPVRQVRSGQPPRMVAPPPVTPEPKPYTIETIKGATRAQVVIK
jgi:pilus assembly protein CpaB